MVQSKSVRKSKISTDAERGIASAVTKESLSASLEAAPVAIVVVNLGGGIALVNALAGQLFGYRREELLGRPIELLLPEALRDAHLKHRAEHVSDPQVRPMGGGREFAARRKDGSEFAADIGLGFVRLDEEAHVIATVVDVTERQQAVAALRESEERYRALYELASDAFFVLHPDGEIIQANQAAADLLGYTVEELIGLRGADGIIAPEVLEETERAWTEQLEKRGRFLVYTSWVRKDGSRFPVAVSGKPLVVRGQQYLQLIGRDITERQQAVAALRESEERFRTLYELASDAFLTVHPDGEIIQANQAAAELLGYTLEELIGLSCADDVMAPEVLEEAERSCYEQLKKRDRFLVDTLWVRRDGSRFPVAVSGKPLVVRGQQQVQLIGRDVTERKQAEEALRESEERYRALYTKTPAMLHSVDKDGRLVAVSDDWLEAFGYERDKVIGRKSVEFLTEDSKRYAKTVALPEFWKTGYARDVPFQFVRKNGDLVDVLLSAIVERNSEGSVLRTMAVLLDVTARKRAEEALRKSEERFRVSLMHSRVVVFNQDIDLRYTWIYNPAGSLYVESNLGKTDVELLPPEDAANLMQLKRQVLTSGVGTRQEIQITAGGHIAWHDLTVEPLRDDTGTVIGITGASFEITERKRTEEALQQTREELEGRVERRMGQDERYGLTFRETTVLHLVAEGMADKEIAAVLGIRPYTVSKHVSNILGKMHSPSRTEAGTRALREGLLG